MKIIDIENTIINKFKKLKNWEEKYEYIIKLGKETLKMEEIHKTERNLISGCQSNVWIYATLNNDKILYQIDSDSILVKGLASIIYKMYNNKTAIDIINHKPRFIEMIGMNEFLSIKRSNGLISIIKHFKFYAIALNSKKTK